jgi:hypothetical protein
VSGVLVLHTFGEPRGGARWRDEGADAPDLPGHGGAAAPTGGCYDVSDPVFVAVPLISADDPPTIVGHRSSSYAAQILAVGGRAERLVLVDGLGESYRAAPDVMGEVFAWLRALADDPGAMTLPLPGRPDPRVGHGIPGHSLPDFDADLAAAVTVPVLVIETPDSPTPEDERDRRVARFGADADVVRLDDLSPAAVLQAIEGWSRR